MTHLLATENNILPSNYLVTHKMYWLLLKKNQCLVFPSCRTFSNSWAEWADYYHAIYEHNIDEKSTQCKKFYTLYKSSRLVIQNLEKIFWHWSFLKFFSKSISTLKLACLSKLTILFIDDIREIRCFRPNFYWSITHVGCRSRSLS